MSHTAQSTVYTQVIHENQQGDFTFVWKDVRQRGSIRVQGQEYKSQREKERERETKPYFKNNARIDKHI